MGIKKCVEGPLENINWHSYFKRTLGLKHKAVIMTVTSLCVRSWKLFGNLLYTISQLQFTTERLSLLNIVVNVEFAKCCLKNVLKSVFFFPAHFMYDYINMNTGTISIGREHGIL